MQRWIPNQRLLVIIVSYFYWCLVDYMRSGTTVVLCPIHRLLLLLTSNTFKIFEQSQIGVYDYAKGPVWGLTYQDALSQV